MGKDGAGRRWACSDEDAVMKGGGYKYSLLERNKTDPSSSSFPSFSNRSPILFLLVLLRAWLLLVLLRVWSLLVLLRACR